MRGRHEREDMRGEDRLTWHGGGSPAISIPGVYIPTCHVTHLPKHLPSHQQLPPNTQWTASRTPCHLLPFCWLLCHPQPHKHARKNGITTMSPHPSPFWGMWVICLLSISPLTTPRWPRWCVSLPSQSKCMNSRASSSAHECCPATPSTVTGMPSGEHLPFPFLILPFPSIVYVLISIN